MPAYAGNEYVGTFIFSANVPQHYNLANAATLTASIQIILPLEESHVYVQHYSMRSREIQGINMMIISRNEITPLPGRGHQATHQSGPELPLSQQSVHPIQALGSLNANGKRAAAGETISGATKAPRTDTASEEPPQVLPTSTKSEPKWDQATVRPKNWPNEMEKGDVCLTCVDKTVPGCVANRQRSTREVAA